MSRAARALGALVALFLVVFGVPALLIAVGRLDALTRVELSAVLTRPDNGSVLLGVLTIIAWVAWLVVALTIVFEAAAVITRGRIRISLPGTGWLRPSIAALIVATGALAAAAPLAGNAPGDTLQGVAPVPPPEPSVAAPLVFKVPAAEVAPAAAPTTNYVVQPADDLWTLASELLGDGMKWHEIAALNTWLDVDTPLEPGTVLRMPIPAGTEAPPAEAAPEPAPAPPAAPAAEQTQVVERTVTVQRGDTLWALAAEHLGDPHRWPEVYDLNRDQIADPDEIDIGWVLTLPPAVVTPAPPAEAPAPPEAEEPTVVAPMQVPVTVTMPMQVPITVTPSDQAPVADPAPVTDTAPVAGSDQADSSDATAAAVVGIGAGLAFGLIAVLNRQRLRQLMQRGLGQRLPQSSEAELRFVQALGKDAQDVPPPDGATQTTVVIGWDGDDAVTVDLESVGVLGIDGTPDHVAGVSAAISSSLLCADWSAGVEQALVGVHECWGAELDDPAVTVIPAEFGLQRVRQLVHARRAALTGTDLAEVRANPDLAMMWQPRVYLFSEPLADDEAAELRQLLADPVGVSAVVPGAHGLVNVAMDADRAVLDGHSFTPQVIGAPARRALIELTRTAVSVDTTPAPWWSDDDLPPNVTPLRHTGSGEELCMDELATGVVKHPTLLLLGPVELLGAAGDEPPRSARLLMEYCAWLLANPGQTASIMTSTLQVAETTRRSNVSRLRNWLGVDSEGFPYLPEAYTGRIQLHPEVTSDWERFLVLTAGGVNRAPQAALYQALSLVRGAPLADAAPWQWLWAEGLRTDMISAVRDAAVVLTDMALSTSDWQLARWAIDRGSAASPDDELLLAQLAVVEHHQGNVEAAQRIARQLTRQSRASGVDLQDRTIVLLQQLLEGRPRSRNL